jgi:hypothetical protein
MKLDNLKVGETLDPGQMLIVTLGKKQTVNLIQDTVNFNDYSGHPYSSIDFQWHESEKHYEIFAVSGKPAEQFKMKLGPVPGGKEENEIAVITIEAEATPIKNRHKFPGENITEKDEYEAGK